MFEDTECITDLDKIVILESFLTLFEAKVIFEAAGAVARENWLEPKTKTP